MTRALLEQALAALEGVLDAPVGVAAQFWSCTGGVYEAVECNNAINALQAELAKPEPTQPVQPSCWCTRCDLEVNTFRSHMAICPLCGDKRCPRAKDHRDDCAAAIRALPEDRK